MFCFSYLLAASTILAHAYGYNEAHDRPSRRQESAATPTELTDCHLHDTTQYCMDGTAEYQIIVNVTASSDLPTSYSDCHAHGVDLYCVAPDGTEVQAVAEGTEATTSTASPSTSGLDCHFHAGVEHCVGAGGENIAQSCDKVSREYNIPFRIGSIFILLAAGAIGAFGPVLLAKWTMSPIMKWATLILKQFGTGVIISTAFVHLFTHANIMFTNECLGELQYEATAAAVFMAGLFLTFIVEYTTHRISDRIAGKHQASQPAVPPESPKEALVTSASAGTVSAVPVRQHETAGVLVLEAGIVFHSLIIGVTLVVAGDSFFAILLIVIVFHQFFEGIALGSRIAVLKSVSLVKKLLMAMTFALTTPVGMAIGIGVLDQFNGNNASTLIAMGTLNAFSSGILTWSGVVEMWAGDWMVPGGEMVNADFFKVFVGGFSLMAGMALMSFLGKWA